MPYWDGRPWLWLAIALCLSASPWPAIWLSEQQQYVMLTPPRARDPARAELDIRAPAAADDRG